jgi:hypothetical protein
MHPYPMSVSVIFDDCIPADDYLSIAADNYSVPVTIDGSLPMIPGADICL